MGKPQSSSGQSTRKGSYAIAGITRDGVEILRSPGRATHFTDKELTAAIARVRSDKERVRTGSSAGKKA